MRPERLPHLGRSELAPGSLTTNTIAIMLSDQEQKFIENAQRFVEAFYDDSNGSMEGDGWEWLEAVDVEAAKWLHNPTWERLQDLADILSARHFVRKPLSALAEGKAKNLFWLSIRRIETRWGFTFYSSPRPANECLAIVSREIEQAGDKSPARSISRGADEGALLSDDDCIPPLYVHESRLVPRRVDDLTRIPSVHTNDSVFPGIRVIHPLVRYLYASHRDAHPTPDRAMITAHIL